MTFTRPKSFPLQVDLKDTTSKEASEGKVAVDSSEKVQFVAGGENK